MRQPPAAAAASAAAMAYTKCAAYFWWLVGGIFGWHHLYLSQPRRAAVMAQTLGAGGVGWLLDAFKVPALVREANDPASAGDVKDGKAVFRVSRLLQAYFLAWLYGALAHTLFALEHDDVRAIETTALRQAAYAAVALAATLGAWYVGGYGQQRTRFWPVLAATAAALQVHDRNEQYEYKTVQVAAVVAAIVAAYFRRPAEGAVASEGAGTAGGGAPAKPKPAAAAVRGGCCGGLWRFAKYATAVGSFWAVAGTALVLHADVPVDGAGNWAKEGLHTQKAGLYLWAHRLEVLGAAKELYAAASQYVNQRGFREVGREAYNYWWAETYYDTLGVPEDASLADVKAAHRKLVRELHPDRLPSSLSEAEREAAITRFRKVQAAYEELSKKLAPKGGGGGGDDDGGGSRRGRRSRRRRGGDDDEL